MKDESVVRSIRSMSSVPSSVPSSRRVLLVDDEPRLRDMLVRAVEQMGFDAAAASTAEAALRMLAEQTFHILILDLNLPGMNGMELFEQVRKDNRNIQVIILTGFGELESAQRAIHLDAVEFLTKPCPLGDLELALDRARQRIDKTTPHTARQIIPAPPVPDAQPAPPISLEDLEREHILATLKKNNGNRTTTASELGISLRKLYYRLGEYQRRGLLP
jgi:DNA-binding NtrC family response regulator